MKILEEYPDHVLITKKEYDSFIKDSDKLEALENGGVDNWEWYGESLGEWYKKYYPEDCDE